MFEIYDKAGNLVDTIRSDSRGWPSNSSPLRYTIGGQGPGALRCQQPS